MLKLRQHGSQRVLRALLCGDRIFNSLYQIQMRLDEQCKVVCKVNSLTEEQVKKMKDSVEDEYRVNMILDNLPTAMVRIREDAGSSIKVYERGFPVGFKAATEEGGDEKWFLHNHARFTILYHKDIETDLARIVGFEAGPGRYCSPCHPTRFAPSAWQICSPRHPTRCDSRFLR